MKTIAFYFWVLLFVFLWPWKHGYLSFNFWTYCDMSRQMVANNILVASWSHPNKPDLLGTSALISHTESNTARFLNDHLLMLIWLIDTGPIGLKDTIVTYLSSHMWYLCMSHCWIKQCVSVFATKRSRMSSCIFLSLLVNCLEINFPGCNCFSHIMFNTSSCCLSLVRHNTGNLKPI